LETTQEPQQAILKGRKLTTWQDNFARYVYQQTGYVPDMQTLKLTLLLQKQFRNSAWNKARLGKAEQPEPLPELPYYIDEIAAHRVPHHEEPKVTPVQADGEMAAMKLTEAGTPAVSPFDPRSAVESDLKEEMGEFWQYRRETPITWTFTGDPVPDPEVIEKFTKRVESARKKAGRRKPAAT
jgi:hypothetical protein